jgi:hypothetical protein
MSLSVRLDLVSGGQAELVLEDPDPFPSSYFISLEDSGGLKFWQFVVKILAASKRTACWFGADLRKLGLSRQDVTHTALRNLVQTSGYTFGIFWHIDPALTGLDPTGNKTFVLVRDPRDVVVSKYLAMKEAGEKTPTDHLGQALVDDSSSSRVLAFVRSSDAGPIVRRFHQVADFCRSANDVTVFRYEDVIFSWRTVVSGLIKKLDLEISPDAASAIADSAEPLCHRSQVISTKQQDLHAALRQHLDEVAISAIEKEFAGPMAYFGYVPERTAPPVFLDHSAEFLRAISERISTVHAQCSDLLARPRNSTQHATASGLKGHLAAWVDGRANSNRFVPRPRGLTEPDPVLLFRLKPNASSEMTVLGRRVMMDVDATGCRPVIGQPQTGEKTLAAYGCSWTYGMAIPSEETFCSLLQSMFPAWRVENHGIFGHGGTQNLMQLERDARWSAPDYVTFCWIKHHMVRNVAALPWVQMLSGMLKEQARAGGGIINEARQPPQKTFPRASLDSDGALKYGSVKFPRWDFIGIDLQEFRPDEYYMDLVCCSLFRRAAEIVKGSGGHFFVTTLQDHLSQHLQRLLKDAGIPVVDASVNGEEYTCLPDDVHPNALANRIFAEKIRDYLVQHEATLIQGGE